jgi:hypothetical protein
MHGTLEHLQNLLRHQVPDGDLSLILERAANLLLEHTMKQRFAQHSRKTKCVEPSDSNRASAARLRASRPTADKPSAATASAAPQQARFSQSSIAATASAAPQQARFSQPSIAATASAAPQQARSSASRSSSNSRSRYVPRAVVREVHARDGERCTFVSPEGRQCAERGCLELHHHDTPYAKGGASTAANLRTVCRAHNALFADHDFGRAFMQSKLAQARVRKRTTTNELAPERQRLCSRTQGNAPEALAAKVPVQMSQTKWMLTNARDSSTNARTPHAEASPRHDSTMHEQSNGATQRP